MGDFAPDKIAEHGQLHDSAKLAIVLRMIVLASVVATDELVATDAQEPLSLDAPRGPDAPRVGRIWSHRRGRRAHSRHLVAEPRNEGGAGDIAMLKYCQSSKYPSFQMIVNHNDSTREYYYQEKDNASLNAAAKNNWHVVSMKDDWKKIFADK